MAQTQRADIENFGGGCNSEKLNHEIQPSESPTSARNMRVIGNSKGPRPGYTTFTTSLGAQESEGIFGWDRESSDDDRLITMHDEKAYLTNVDTETRGTGIETSVTGDFKTNFTEYKDWAFAFNGNDEIGRIAEQSVTFANIAAATIAFVDSNPDTITDSGSGFVTAGFVAGDTIIVTGSASNDGTYTIDSVVAGTITLDAGDALVAEGAGASVVIKKQLQSADTSSKLAASWGFETGSYDIIFSNGDEAVVTLTNGATTATWSPALTAVATNAATTIAYDEPATKPDSISSASDFTPLFGTVFLNSMIAGGVPTAKNSFFISKAALTDAPEDVFDFSGALGAGNAEEVLMQSRGTAVVEMSGFAVLFTINSASIVTGFKDLGTKVVADVQPIKGADGCANERCAVVVGNDVYYITPKKEIRTVRKGFDESLSALTDPVSRKIDSTLTRIVDDSFANDAHGYYDRKDKLVKFYVRSVGSLFPDLCITGNLEELDENGNPKWTFDDGKGFVDSVFFKNKSFALSTGIGQLFEDEVGLADYNDVTIPVNWDTKNFNGGVPTVRKRYRNVNIYGFISTTTSITVIVFVDDIEATRVIIDENDILTNDNNLGGIANETTGEFTVGDDEVLGEAAELFELVKRIPFRKTGRKIKIRFETDQINTNYLISAGDYDAIGLGKENVPISEKL